MKKGLRITTLGESTSCQQVVAPSPVECGGHTLYCDAEEGAWAQSYRPPTCLTLGKSRDPRVSISISATWADTYLLGFWRGISELVWNG